MIDKLHALLAEFKTVQINDEEPPTFLQIARVPHYENVWSNMLAFFFQTNNEHALGDLLVKSLFQCLSNEDDYNPTGNVFAQTEYTTLGGGRIDILLTTDTYVVGIENKVNHGLYNDLKDYAATLHDSVSISNKKLFKIVLSKHKNEMSDGFKNILYADFINAVRCNLPDYTAKAHPKYLIFLEDFLLNIEKDINFLRMKNNKEAIDFLTNNAKSINELLKLHNNFKADLVRILNQIDEGLNRKGLIEAALVYDDQAQLIGSSSNRIKGRFTWEGHDLIKYKMIIKGVDLDYQIGITKYQYHTKFWFKENRFDAKINDMANNGMVEMYINYNAEPNDIINMVESQMKLIMAYLNNINL